MALLAPAALAQSRGPSGADGTYNCSDFDDQGQAQEFFLRAGGPGSDPNGLDKNKNGIACESLPTAQPPQTAQPQQQPQQPAASATAATLPQTGGISPLLPVGGLLVGSGILALTISRRR